MSTERHSAPNPHVLFRRLLLHLAFSVALLAASLGVGMWGYNYYEHLPWRDAFLNAAMLLGGWAREGRFVRARESLRRALRALFGVGRDRRHRPTPRAGYSSHHETGALGGSIRYRVTGHRQLPGETAARQFLVEAPPHLTRALDDAARHH